MQDPSAFKPTYDFSNDFGIHDADKTALNRLSHVHNSELLLGRNKLRLFLKEKGFRQPDFFIADDFAAISAWAVRRNQFPMVLKTGENLYNGELQYLLKAFRELPQFCEELGSHKPIMIESYFSAKARIEVTFFNGQQILIAQSGMEKSLRFRCSWRVFPILPPSGCRREIIRMQQLFADLIAVKDLPIRFSFAFNTEQTTLLSINCGFNRHEYFPGWGDFLAEPQVFQVQPTKIFKLMFYKNDNFAALDLEDLKKVLHQTLANIMPGSTTAVLLAAENPALLLEDSKKADAWFKHHKADDLPLAQEPDD